jgi:hypothetical protein
LAEPAVEKQANKKLDQTKKEIIRAANIFAQLLDGEGSPSRASYGLLVEKLTKYRESIAHLVAVKTMKKGDDYHQHNLHMAELQGAYEALGYAIDLPKSYLLAKRAFESKNKPAGKPA